MSAAEPQPDAAADLSALVLPEPARQRLVQLASDVIGRLGPDEVPPALRTIARFTPPKRVRLGAPAISAALDADGAFRDKVADAVRTGTPQLAEAVAAGDPTPASDPLDTVVVAYLLRPADWVDRVTEATARWTRTDPGEDGSAAAIDRLRGEVAELRARARTEPARIRDAAAAARAELEAELAELRRSLRSRSAALRAAERERDEAREALADLERRSSVAAAAADAELRRARARIGELERAGEASRRSARADREVDDARLRLLLDTLSDAVAGMRRELSLPASATRPADVVAAERGDTAGSGPRAARDPAGLDQLLVLPQLHLIVDGYNVTKSGYPELSLADQRSRLVSALATLGGRCGAEVTVVFDGAGRPTVQPRVPRGVRVIFSAPDEIADDVIRRLVAAEPPGRPVLVATSDQQVVADVQRDGAWTVPSVVLLARLS
jgi:predicted RNA-binding protein with PIN domain